ncbi:2OG-Fe dioxygenase family protein [Wenzhouxiangella marina]|uniref:Uncharacterized protein n=1 Tax=Wenzhouxiangella marina TaxID=1579979 RepID=A0A0K0XUY0_9GAMM|nr:2OG-Fe dioxygenase family protein [Wenzhouxiangella marina]AKS41488.1 hypothetical protein WM2015_1114 [Wenzhouxiangella marina]MBB6086754.1 hypothetical protein [Wenzhouxiangella marina]
MKLKIEPPWTRIEALDRTLSETGYALLDPQGVRAWSGLSQGELDMLLPFWDRLPPDPHLRDGGRYRRRRHGCYIASESGLQLAPHRAHWQPLAYNALHGGMRRWFEPLEEDMLGQAAWSRLIERVAEQASRLHGSGTWFLEAHPFRIDTTDGIGRPTPEGAHRDGVDLVAVFMLKRHAIKGGESRVFDADGPNGLRFTLDRPWSLLLLDDRRVIHESTPIQPLVNGELGWRDTLVVTCRAKGFQGDKETD